MNREQFLQAISSMSHSKSDCKRFLKACDISFSGSIKEYRRNFTVLLNDGRLMAYSGMTNSFYDVTPHTNKRWHEYPEYGCFYRLEGGTLMYSADEGEESEVELLAMEPAMQVRLLEIIKELEVKQ